MNIQEMIKLLEGIVGIVGNVPVYLESNMPEGGYRHFELLCSVKETPVVSSDRKLKPCVIIREIIAHSDDEDYDESLSEVEFKASISEMYENVTGAEFPGTDQKLEESFRLVIEEWRRECTV